MVYSIGNLLIVMVSVIALSTGCDSTKKMSNQDKGVAVGAAGGAVIGGIIGNNVGNKKNSVLGAVIGAAVGGAAGGVIGSTMDRQAEEIKNEIPGADVQRVGEGINITFDENNPDGSKAGVFFATDKSDINANSRLALDKLVKIFTDYPETNILIEGHTDDVGTETYNQKLSKKRAKAVGKYLTDAGIASSRLTIKWYGETQPKVANNIIEGRAHNRRVEFGIMANSKMKEEAQKQAEKL